MSSSSGYLTDNECAGDSITLSTRIPHTSLKKEQDNWADKEQYAHIEEPLPEYKKTTACAIRSYIIIIISLVVLAGSGIVIGLILYQNCDHDENCSNTTPPKSEPQVYHMRRGDSGYMNFTIYLEHITEVRLLKETVYGNDTIFIVGNLTNDTLINVGNDQMNFSVFVKDAEIQASVYIYIIQCHLGGNYYVQAISDEIGFKFIRSELDVLSECSCRYKFNVSSFQNMRCSFPDADNASIMIERTSFDNHSILVNWSDIIRPIDIPNTNGFSASWLHNGTLVVEIQLGPIRCADEGYYNISLTMNGISQIYDVYVHVIDYPEKPLLAVLGGGIIEHENGQISCEAFTGCTYTSLMLESKIIGTEEWIEYLNLSTKFKLTDMGWETQSLMNITLDKVYTVDRKKFRCSYTANKETITSGVICVRMIPANVCQNKAPGCHHQHPFFCNKFITCTRGPLERNCPPKLHFLYKGDCGGQCKSQTIDYKNNCNGYCDYPENVNCTENPANLCD